MGCTLGHTESKELLRRRCEKAAFLAQRKLLEKFVAMERSPARVEMMKKTLQKSVEVAAAMTDAENVRLYQKLDKSHHSLDAAKKAAESYSGALDAELEKAHKMQKDFLPANIPEIPDWEIETCFQPAIQVAGDFYDVFRLPGNYLGLVIGDVCDKGVGSALYMALLRSLIRIFSGQTQLYGLSIDQEEAMTHSVVDFRDFCDIDQTQPLRAIPLTNNYLLQNHSEMCMFATIFFGVLNPDTGSLVYINAGHLAPLIVGSDGVIKHHLGSTGPFVGVVPQLEFKVQHIQIDPGDILISYTDGVTEATSADEEFFMQKRLEEIVTQHCASAGEMISKIQAAISAFTGNVPQYDDITILAVRRENVN